MALFMRLQVACFLHYAVALPMSNVNVGKFSDAFVEKFGNQYFEKAVAKGGPPMIRQQADLALRLAIKIANIAASVENFRSVQEDLLKANAAMQQQEKTAANSTGNATFNSTHNRTGSVLTAAPVGLHPAQELEVAELPESFRDNQIRLKRSVIASNKMVMVRSALEMASTEESDVNTKDQVVLRGQSTQNSYFLLCGSALGVYRDGRNPDRDDDIDIAIPYERLGAVHQAFESVGIPSRPSGGHYGIFSSSAKISFWGYKLSPDKNWLCFGCWVEGEQCRFRDAYPVDMMLPARNFYVTDVENLKMASMPTDPDRYLALRYGSDWMTPQEGAKPTIESMNERFDQYCKGSDVGI